MDLNYINNLPKPVVAPNTGPEFARPDVEGMKERLFTPRPVVDNTEEFQTDRGTMMTGSDLRAKLNQNIEFGGDYTPEENDRIAQEEYDQYQRGDYRTFMDTLLRNSGKIQPIEEHLKDQDDSSSRNMINNVVYNNKLAMDSKRSSLQDGTGAEGFWSKVTSGLMKGAGAVAGVAGPVIQDLLGREGTPQYAGQKAYWQALSMGMGLPGATKAYMDVYDATMKHQQSLALNQAKFKLEKGADMASAGDTADSIVKNLYRNYGVDTQLGKYVRDQAYNTLISNNPDLANAGKKELINKLFEANLPEKAIIDVSRQLGITGDPETQKEAQEMLKAGVTQGDVELYKLGRLQGDRYQAALDKVSKYQEKQKLNQGVPSKGELYEGTIDGKLSYIREEFRPGKGTVYYANGRELSPEEWQKSNAKLAKIGESQQAYDVQKQRNDAWFDMVKSQYRESAGLGRARAEAGLGGGIPNVKLPPLPQGMTQKQADALKEQAWSEVKTETAPPASTTARAPRTPTEQRVAPAPQPVAPSTQSKRLDVYVPEVRTTGTEVAKNNIKQNSEFTTELTKSNAASQRMKSAAENIKDVLQTDPDLWQIVSRNVTGEIWSKWTQNPDNAEARKQVLIAANIPVGPKRDKLDRLLNQYAILQKEAVTSVPASLANSVIEGEAIKRTVGSLNDSPVAAGQILDDIINNANRSRDRYSAWAKSTEGDRSASINVQGFNDWFDSTEEERAKRRKSSSGGTTRRRIKLD